MQALPVFLINTDLFYSVVTFFILKAGWSSSAKESDKLCLEEKSVIVRLTFFLNQTILNQILLYSVYICLSVKLESLIIFIALEMVLSPHSPQRYWLKI